MTNNTDAVSEFRTAQLAYQDALKALKVQTERAVRARLTFMDERTMNNFQSHGRAQAELRRIHDWVQQIAAERDAAWERLYHRKNGAADAN